MSAVLLDINHKSDTLLILVSAKLSPGQDFNFKKSTSSLPVRKIFVRDLYNLWYHGAHPGVGEGVDSIVAYLKKLLAQQSPEVKRVIVVGCSMGGYAAILIGTLIGADIVVAVNPQTNLSPLWRRKHLDLRSAESKRKIYTTPSARPAYFDLLTVLERQDQFPRIYVHYGNDRLDLANVRRLRGLPNVEFVHYAWYDHRLIIAWKRAGLLPAFLEGCLTENWAKLQAWDAARHMSKESIKTWCRSRLKAYLAPIFEMSPAEVVSGLRHLLSKKAP